MVGCTKCQTRRRLRSPASGPWPEELGSAGYEAGRGEEEDHRFLEIKRVKGLSRLSQKNLSTGEVQTLSVWVLFEHFPGSLVKKTVIPLRFLHYTRRANDRMSQRRSRRRL